MTVSKQSEKQQSPFFLWKHLNKIRWVCLTLIFLSLILLPFISVYQNYVASHGYDRLLPEQKQLFDVMEFLTSPFVSDPESDLDAVKGTTWSGSFWGFKISDPLAVLGQIFAALSMQSIYWLFVLTALLPIILTVIFGRFFCGWICPATFLYELNSNLALLLSRLGFHVGKNKLPANMRYLKYAVLAIGLILSMYLGSVLVASIYPPAIIGREIYYAIAFGGFGGGAIFFLLTMAFDLFVVRRGFCRYLCPGGAVYSVLGRYRLFRIKRIVENCNDCAKCNAVCEFGLDPLNDNFGQECNNCSACIATCPTNAMTFIAKSSDVPPQGAGHLGHRYRNKNKNSSVIGRSE